MLHVLIMAGGGGTRFWPRSRQKRPKQFLALGGDRTLLQQSLDRIEAQVPPDRTWVITSAAHREQVLRQLGVLAEDRVVGEPVGRDTAPCIGLGAALVARRDPQAVMLAMPADHVIEPVQEFRHEGVQPMGPDLAAGLPQDLGGGGDVGPVAARAAGPRGGRRAPWRPAQHADGGLAVHPADRDDLVQELPLLGARGLQVTIPLDGGVFPKAGSCHGLLLAGVGNRDF